MAIIIGCLVPHPPIIIPEIGHENLQKVTKTVEAMKSISADVAETRPDTLVFISPHSTGFRDAIAVKTDPMLAGDFTSFGVSSVSVSVENDLAFVARLFETAKTLGINIIGTGKENFDIPNASALDHGIMVPLYYLAKNMSIPIVAIAIDSKGYHEHFTLGKAIGLAATASEKRIALIASGDLSHRLIPGAPNGYNPRGAEFEANIENMFHTGHFDELKSLDPNLIEAAGECGLRSIYALAGAFENTSVSTKVLSHEGPFGVGYMVATVRPLKQDSSADKPNADNSKYSIPVELAMHSLKSYFDLGHAIDPPDNLPEEFLNKRAGAFVCLKIGGNLRGCIGTIQPTYNNIAEEIMANAIQAATADPRFFPVSEHELPNLTFAVDILEEPEPINSEKLLDPKTYGVIVRNGYRTGLLLPNLDGVDTVAKQIAIAKKKAGIDQFEDAELYRFKVIRYE